VKDISLYIRKREIWNKKQQQQTKQQQQERTLNCLLHLQAWLHIVSVMKAKHMSSNFSFVVLGEWQQRFHCR